MMGNRVNFGFRAGGNTVFLYEHWNSGAIFAPLANALAFVRAAGRLGDPAYATRVCISQLIGNGWGSDTGFGITVNKLDDNEHRVPVVDWDNQVVVLCEYDGFTPIFQVGIENFITKYATDIPARLS